MPAKCVIPYEEGRDAVLSKKHNFFLKAKGVLVSAILSVIFLTGKPFWWDEIYFPHVTIQLNDLLFNILGGFLFITVMLLWYLGYRTERSLNIKYLLHKFAHDIRDEHTSLLKKLHDRNKTNQKEAFQSHLKLLATQTREYFQNILNDQSIGVAIRLAKSHPTEPGNVVYETVVRRGLNNNREKTSEAIAANEGLPRYLIEKQRGCKILIYKDIDKATEYQLFKRTESERQFPNDVKTMMVAPLNGWDGNKKSLIGILYVTSKKSNVFQEKHVDSMKFIADKISDTVAITASLINLLIRENNRHKTKSPSNKQK